MRASTCIASLSAIWLLAACSGSESLDDSAGTPGGPDPVLAACADGQDNDADGLVDFPDDPGCDSADDDSEDNLASADTKTRYAMASQCWALRSVATGQYVARSGSDYSASADAIAEAEPLFFKATALGKYVLYDSQRELITVDTPPALTQTASADATDAAEFTVLGVGDTTAYPATPAYHTEPTPEYVAEYHGFEDPNLLFDAFTLASDTTATRLGVDGDGQLVAVAAADEDAQAFAIEPTTGCAAYPEASSNFTGTPFSGTQPDGTVLGHADVHVHISASEFLGGAQWGRPYHKFGVEHALGNCSVDHGETGQMDLVGGLFTNDPDGHATDGYPTFSEWPARGMLTHEAIYWKWLERSWAAGLRVAVNDLVDNETLCELQRNAAGNVTEDCNSMNNAGRQAGTMYGMQDYIDAQYGGRGEGFFQIVHDPAEARAVIEDGKMAVVLGIEISNLFDCKLTYQPTRTQTPEVEDGSGGIENSYGCTIEEGQPNSILTQMERIHAWGVRQIISIHEFDNAFGGNGIFDGLVLNLGNRENSGGIPSGDVAEITGLLSGSLDPAQVTELAENLQTTETPTGEFWTTYDCPIEGETENFTGYLWSSTGGSTQSFLSPPLCVPTGQGGRSGGTTPCYPADVRQCNARWMTPAGLYTYGKMMELGFIFDFDHMEMGMKTQALELAEAQTPVYPLVSTHGTFGGTTIDQAARVLRGGGHLYPSNGSSRGFRSDMDETFAIYQAAVADLPAESRPLFGFGYGTDTNGLSSQTGPRGNFEPEDAVVYPYTLYTGEVFDELPEFAAVDPVVFHQPSSVDADGVVQRTWHEDIDGNAHHGMLSGFVEEIRLEGTPEQMRHLFNSAEVYLQTWERTEASKAAIQANGLQVPDGVLRPAPPEGEIAP